MQVYVFGSDEGPLKIGVSLNPESRLASLQGGHPYKLRIMGLWEHEYAGKIERAAHRALAEHRMAGEWFSISFNQAREAIERVIAESDFAAAQAPEPELARPVTMEMEEEIDPTSAMIRRLQQRRRNRVEEIEAQMQRQLTRREIIDLELAGEFGPEWARVRREQGWEPSSRD